MAEATIRSIRPENGRTSTRGWIATIGLVMAALAAASMVTAQLEPPRVVDLAVENGTAFDVHLDGIGWARRGGTTTFHQVIDEGDGWVVDLDYAGIDAGTAAVVDGSLVVPASAEDALRDAGRVPQP